MRVLGHSGDLDGRYLLSLHRPHHDQEGNVRIEEGVTPTVEELEAADYLIKGVVGTIPQ